MNNRVKQGVGFHLRVSLALLVFWLSTWAPWAAAEFRVEEIRFRNQGDLLVMDADIHYGFSEEALEALDNGVPLTLEVHIRLRGADDWVWTRSLMDQRLRHVIRYQPLSEQYLVSHGEAGSSYVTRDAAITALGKIDGLALTARDKADRPLVLWVQAALDIDKLPLPLRPIAYLLPAWKLSSGWTQWPFQP